MNLGRLRIFDEVARRGTFAGAADALSYTPSAVSQQMAKLEAELASVLLVRTPRGVRLTDAGRVLADRTRAILAEVGAARAELDALAGLRAGTVRLGSFPTATRTLAARALRAFADRCPDVEVVLVDGEADAHVCGLLEHELDLALVAGVDPAGALAGGRVVLEPVLEDRFVLVLPEGHRLANGAVELDDLDGETIVGSEGLPGLDAFAAACRARGFEPRFNRFVLADPLAVRALVAAGEGVAVVPGLAADGPVDGTVARPLLDGAPSRPVALARPADGLVTAAGGAMREVLLEVAAAYAGVPGSSASDSRASATSSACVPF